MIRLVSIFGISCACTALLLLGGCGGGSSGGGGGAGTAPPPPVATTPAPPAAVLSGVAATGAPFSGAALAVVDASGATVCATVTDTQGGYGCTLATSAKAPLVVTASRGDQVLYSVAATSSSGRLNVTPLTTIIVSRLAPDGNPAKLASLLSAQPELASAAAVAQQVAQLKVLLQPLLTALGDVVDPLIGTFTADGSGHDRVLDSISVSIRPDGSAANIEIIVKTVPVGGVVTPVAISFRSNEPSPAPLPSMLSESSVAPAGLSQAVAALTTRLTTCYALPLSQRVTAANDTVAVTGGPADVIAPACRSLFVGDDPASYLSGGVRVGRNALNGGAFSGLFRPGSTGVVFDWGQFEFYRPNGDVVFSYRTRSTGGAEENQTIVARDVGGTLKLIGNQYVYGASVTAFVQDRDYISQPEYRWFSTGYDVFINNQVDAQNNPIFAKVVVTLPGGTALDYVPTTGLSYLAARRVSDALVTTTSVVRLAGGFRNAGTPGNPADLEGTLFVLPIQASEAQISALSNQSLWRLEFFHVDANVPNVVQSYRTVSRPYTLLESQQQAFTELTPAMRAEFIAATAAAGRLTFGAVSATQPNVVNVSASGGQDAWVVPQHVTAPTALSIYGRTVTNNVQSPLFNDSVSVASTTRKAQVFCAPQTSADTHCDNSTGVLQYAPNAFVSSLQLSGTSSRQVVYSELANFFRLVP